ncbi:zinc finger matrin-type 5 [Brachionus plicatilis]|uniref:Zinc finger matrin-type 5 n=1 Tax=Brachionus plicatilis TaxID=10195 RepID=A0A3M7R3B2_BRAPC|nr:zinc finger matrin-type 5 [Brachionus plicatilis]
MGKRYYCDFCDKSIPNNSDAIKKHNEGTQHQTIRKNYYLKYKDLETILEEEREKTHPCIRFFNHGHCNFGELCWSSHRTQEQKQHLEDLYRLECHKKVKFEEEKRKNEAPIKKKIQVKEYLSEHLGHLEKHEIENFFPKYFVPKKIKLLNMPIIPPSLVPPNFNDFINYEPNSWSDDPN